MSSSNDTLKDLLSQVRAMAPWPPQLDAQRKELFGMLLHTVELYHAKKSKNLSNSCAVKPQSISTSRCGLKVTPIYVSPLKHI